MNKILLIIKREYLTRIRNKTFIIMTIVGPLLFGGFIGMVSYFTTHQGDEISRIKVIDETEGSIFSEKLKNADNIIFEKENKPYQEVVKNFDTDVYYGILYIPNTVINSPNTFKLVTQKKANPFIVDYIRQELQKQFEDFKLRGSGIDPNLIAAAKTRVNLIQTTFGSGKQSSADVTSVIGFLGGIFMYFFIIMYGIQVMRGVMEEKTNRIVEVIISSVKPFQLMMGKIIGIAMVGLTQFALWAVLTTVISGFAIGTFANRDKVVKQQVEQYQKMQQEKTGDESIQNILSENLESINIPLLLFSFVFYFLGGYLLYSALFAAIGSAIDVDSDTQQFMLPITLPLVFGYIASLAVMQNPDSSLGYWCSLIPLTSPIVMMVRMPFDPPVTDIIISMTLLVLGFLATTWLAAKIYRTGILMYGKKVSYKELAKWITYRG